MSKSFDPKPTTETSGSPYTNMPVTLRSLQERNNALEGQSRGIFTKHLLIGLEMERKYDLQNESFAGQIPFISLSLYFFNCLQKTVRSPRMLEK